MLAGVSYAFRLRKYDVIITNGIRKIMSNKLKKNFALAGISSRCYTVEDMEMMEQFKTTSKYKKWKEEREQKRKKILKKTHNYKEAFDAAYGDYTPSYMKLKVIDKPRLRVR